MNPWAYKMLVEVSPRWIKMHVGSGLAGRTKQINYLDSAIKAGRDDMSRLRKGPFARFHTPEIRLGLLGEKMEKAQKLKLERRTKGSIANIGRMVKAKL